MFVGGSGTAYVHGVSFPVEQEVLSAIQGLVNGAHNYVQVVCGLFNFNYIPILNKTKQYLILKKEVSVCVLISSFLSVGNRRRCRKNHIILC